MEGRVDIEGRVDNARPFVFPRRNTGLARDLSIFQTAFRFYRG